MVTPGDVGADPLDGIDTTTHGSLDGAAEYLDVGVQGGRRQGAARPDVELVTDNPPQGLVAFGPALGSMSVSDGR